jgi:phosphoribosylformylglycinamidine synthase
LTNKVDRCVGGKVKQQTTGPLQLPLNNCGVMALDYNGKEGIATYRAFAVAALLDPVAGSRTAIEALSNIVWALSKVWTKFLSANWMWACKTKEKMLVCTLPAVRILQSNWDQYSNRKDSFMKQKYQMKK